LIKPASHYNELIVREFFANAYPLKQKSEKSISCWVKGKKVLYDRDTIKELPRLVEPHLRRKEKNFKI